jgi:hypothetical protein
LAQLIAEPKTTHKNDPIKGELIGNPARIVDHVGIVGPCVARALIIFASPPELPLSLFLVLFLAKYGSNAMYLGI